jgi:F0F1-type ATP synthase membrane subunit b/b'
MKSWRRLVSLAAGAIAAFLLATIPVLAAEAAQSGPADSTAGLIFRWLNFFLVFGGIGYLIAKHGGSYFKANAKAIASSITQGQAAKAAADAELNEVNAKISRLDQEVAELREAARRDGMAEAERLRASGVSEIEKIDQAARAELAASERAAQQQLREAAASMAVERAGDLVHSGMNVEVRARMFHSFLGELGRSAN